MRVLDLKSEVMRGSGSIPTEGDILNGKNFFDSDANVLLLPTLCIYGKTRIYVQITKTKVS